MRVPGGAVHVGEGVFLEDAGAVDQQGDRAQLGLGLAPPGRRWWISLRRSGRDRRPASLGADLGGGGLGLVVDGAHVDGHVIAGVRGGAEPGRGRYGAPRR